MADIARTGPAIGPVQAPPRLYMTGLEEFARRADSSPGINCLRDGRGSGGLPPVAPSGAARSAGGWTAVAGVFDFCAERKKSPRSSFDDRGLENGGYLLSQLVGQYHRRW